MVADATDSERIQAAIVMWSRGDMSRQTLDLIGAASRREVAPHPALEPQDITLEKPRFGAFYGTDLEMILRARGIDTVIITGISTDVCCDTTAREANARDFLVLFVSDATVVNAETEEKAAVSQEATLNVIEGLFGRVVSIDDLRGVITASAHR